MPVLLIFLPLILVGGSLALWIAMLVHAIKTPIPDKLVWILVLVFTNTLGAVTYYFMVYCKMASKDRRALKKWTQIIGAGVVLLLALITISALTVTPMQTKGLEEVSLSELIQQVDRGDVRKIEVRGDQLFITRPGDKQPSLHSQKEPDSSLQAQGIDVSKVEIYVSRP